jgi:biopolymer transport protein ExbD
MLSPQKHLNQEIKAEINITPLVDIMLVLLIIFIITAPLIHPSQLNINLPRTGSVSSPPTPPEKLEVALDAKGHLFFNGQEVPDAELTSRLTREAKSHDDRISLVIDQTLSYQRVAEVMVLLQQSGMNKLSFVLNSK